MTSVLFVSELNKFLLSQVYFIHFDYPLNFYPIMPQNTCFCGEYTVWEILSRGMDIAVNNV